MVRPPPPHCLYSALVRAVSHINRTISHSLTNTVRCRQGHVTAVQMNQHVNACIAVFRVEYRKLYLGVHSRCAWRHFLCGTRS